MWLAGVSLTDDLVVELAQRLQRSGVQHTAQALLKAAISGRSTAALDTQDRKNILAVLDDDPPAGLEELQAYYCGGIRRRGGGDKCRAARHGSSVQEGRRGEKRLRARSPLAVTPSGGTAGTLEVRRQEGVAVIRLLGEHDMSTGAALGEEIDQHIAAGDGVVVSLMEAEFIDSTVVRQLYRGDDALRKLRRAVRALQLRSEPRGPPPDL